MYAALLPSWMLDALLDGGFRYAFISNSDNLAAVLEPRVLAWIAREEIPFVMEVTDRTEADRKGGHILPVDGGRHVYGVDHGVTFSPVPKLRTVLWGWRGTTFTPDELAGLERIRAGLDGELGAALDGLLSRLEVRATARRVEGLLASGRFPYPSPDWPAVPWPPF